MFKSMMLWLHRYVGISLGLLVVVATVTGSLAVFAPEIDRWLNPELFEISPAAPQEPLSSTGAVENANLERFTRLALASYPGQSADFKPAFATMRLPLQANESVRLLMIDSFSEPHGPWWQAYGDPRSGELLGTRSGEDSFAGKLIGLHIGLLQGEHSTGTLLIGIGGILTLGFALTGIYLWWPGLRGLGRSLKVTASQGARKFWLDLHKLSGILILVPLVVVTVTGLFYVFPQATRTPLEQVLNVPDREGGAPSAPATGQVRITVDQALAAASQAFPEARATTVTIPFSARGSYSIRKHFPDDPQRQYTYGNALVWVDQYTGEVLKTLDERGKPGLARLFHNLIFPLHSGEIAGLAGRWAYFLTGLIPLGLFMTGVYCWYKMRTRIKREAPGRAGFLHP